MYINPSTMYISPLPCILTLLPCIWAPYHVKYPNLLHVLLFRTMYHSPPPCIIAAISHILLPPPSNPTCAISSCLSSHVMYFSLWSYVYTKCERSMKWVALRKVLLLWSSGVWWSTVGTCCTMGPFCAGDVCNWWFCLIPVLGWSITALLIYDSWTRDKSLGLATKKRLISGCGLVKVCCKALNISTQWDLVNWVEQHQFGIELGCQHPHRKSLF